MSRMQEKVEDYIRMGVDSVWVVDPRRRTVQFAERSVTLQPAGEFLEAAGTQIRVPVGEIFAELDEMEGLG
jgi:Uma2 family endonuclease